MILARIFGMLLFLAGWCAHAVELKPQVVLLPYQGKTMRCFLYKPEGNGPFPVVIWNHGSDKGAFKSDKPFLKLADFYTRHGFVFYVPLRFSNLELEETTTDQAELFVVQTRQIRAAIDTLKLQSLVNE